MASFHGLLIHTFLLVNLTWSVAVHVAAAAISIIIATLLNYIIFKITFILSQYE